MVAKFRLSWDTKAGPLSDWFRATELGSWILGVDHYIGELASLAVGNIYNFFVVHL